MRHAILLHGFGVRYDLPISLALYLYAAGAVVAISFVLVAIFASSAVGEQAVRYPRLRAAWLDALFNSPLPRAITGTVGVLALVAIVTTGWFGSPEPTRNPAEYLTWIYFWAALVIASGLVGNLWTLFNPWTAIYDFLTRWVKPPAPRPLPERLGVWPAAFFYLAFACLELTSGMANRPWFVAILAVAYTGWTLIGMFHYGRDPWLRHFEAFTALFGIVGRFAPVEIEQTGGRRRVYLRWWGTGLLDVRESGWDVIVFVILMLSTLAFDGLIATPFWQVQFLTALQPVWLPLGQFGFFLVRTFGLLLLTGVFILAFTVFMHLVIRFSSTRVDVVATMTAFVFTLVPIALVYNAAHNYTYLVVQSQGLIPLLADPFAKGWRLLPTSGYQPSFALAGAAMVWYAQIVLIVAGHIVAVYLAHLRAGERFKTARRALMSQYPMLALMVLYTMTSLWILAQPITREAG